MAARRPPAISRAEDLPAVWEAERFRHHCVMATHSLARRKETAAVRAQIQREARGVVACAASTWEATEWRAAREQLRGSDLACAEALRGLYELYRDGELAGKWFDGAARAAARLRLALAATTVNLRERRGQ
jgi:hypothetical protein